MFLNRNTEILFTKNIRKAPGSHSLEDQTALFLRNKQVARKFEFSAENCAALEHLNHKLLQEEKRIFVLYRSLEKQCLEWKEHNLIDEYKMEIQLECWNKNYYVQFDSDLEGNPFFRTSYDFMPFQKNIIYKEQDFYELSAAPLLPKSKHCYSFHHLYDHTYLTFYDLCHIDEVWMELKVTYQNFASL